MPTGYFGILGRHQKRDETRVHFVLKGKPICGATLRKEMEFQVCSLGFEAYFVECHRCKRFGLVGARRAT